MNQTIEQIKPETIVLIESQAKLAGLTVDDYIKSLMPNVNGNDAEKQFYETVASEKRTAALKAWINGPKSDAPALALEDISRETIY